MARSKNENHNLMSKADIADALGMSSQHFSNRMSRDGKFPQPTYQNRTGTVSLYSQADAKKVYDYVTKADRDRLERAARAFGFADTEDQIENIITLTDDSELEGQTSVTEALDEDEKATDEAPKIDADTDAEFDKALTKTPAEKAADKSDARKIAATDNNTGTDDKAAPKDLREDLDAGLDKLIANMDAGKAEAKADAGTKGLSSLLPGAETKAAPRRRGGALQGRK